MQMNMFSNIILQAVVLPDSLQLQSDSLQQQSDLLQHKSDSLQQIPDSLLQVRPMKDILDNPFSITDWYPVVALVILIILLFLLIIYLIRCSQQQKPLIRLSRPQKPLLPHEKALAELEMIKEFSIQGEESEVNNKQKQYFSRLTDIIRQYFEERYHIPAMEMTTRQIIDALTEQKDKAMLDELRYLFRTADLVKFAKHEVENTEITDGWEVARCFIESTKPTSEELKDKEPEREPEPEPKKYPWRTITIILLCIAEIALLAIMIYTLYDLCS